jgi:hypothetical protein
MPCSKLEVSKELNNLLLNIHHEKSFGTCDKVRKANQPPPLFIKKKNCKLENKNLKPKQRDPYLDPLNKLC